MNLIVGMMGLGWRATSNGIHNGVERLSKQYGWTGQTYTHIARVGPANLIRKHQGERIILVGNSLGVDAIDDILEANPDLKVDTVFAVVSAMKETFPSNVKEVVRVIASNDRLRNFELKHPNIRTIEIDASHVAADDSEQLWQEVEKYMNAVAKIETDKYQLTPKVVLEVAVHEGLVQEAYRDSKGIWTWSIGVTDFSGHKVGRYINNPVDIERCIEVYIWLLDTKYLPAVQRAFQGRELTESQLAAALSFHWNTGAIEEASWVREFLAGNTSEAKRKFMFWRKPPEIIERRQRERDLFFDGVWHGNGLVTHYPQVGSNGRLIHSAAKSLDITSEVTNALNEHYAPALPVPIDNQVPSAPEPVTSDLEQYLEINFPNQTDAARNLAAMIAVAIRYEQEVPTLQITNQPKETNMLDKLPFDGSKTVLGFIAIGVVAVLEGPMNFPVPDYIEQMLWAWTGIGGAHKVEKLVKAYETYKNS